MNLNEDSYRKLARLEGFEGVLKTELTLDSKKATILDVGVNAKPKESTEISVLTAKASTGGLAEVRVEDNTVFVEIPGKVALATLGCQMAGWAVKIQGENALASGPARVLARKPKSIFKKIRYRESSDRAAIILESNNIPDRKSCEYILDETGANELMMAVFRGDSKVGLFNVLARVVELAVFRLDFLGYDVNNILSAKGEVEIPRECDMCTANDALIYNSTVELEVKNWDDSLTEKCTSKSSKHYGKKFKEIYEQAGRDFYKIDESIFAPAKMEIRER